MRMNIRTVLASLALVALLAPHASSANPFKKDFDSVRGKPHAQRLKLYKELVGQNVDSGDKLRALHEEMKQLESESRPKGNPQQVFELQQPLADALEHSGNPAAQSAVAELLKEETAGDWRNMLTRKDELRAIRLRSLIYSTGRARNAEALPTLRRIRKARGSESKAAETAIGQIGRPEDLEEFLSEIKQEQNSNINLDGFGEQAVDRIIKDVNDPKVPDNQKMKIVGRLPRLPSATGIARYRPLLKHSDSRVTEIASGRIADVLAPDDVNQIRELLGDPNPLVHGPTLAALERLIPKNPSLAPLVVEALRNDRDDYHRAIAATILGIDNVKSAKPSLQTASASDPNPSVRKAAAEALRIIKD